VISEDLELRELLKNLKEFLSINISDKAKEDIASNNPKSLYKPLNKSKIIYFTNWFKIIIYLY